MTKTTNWLIPLLIIGIALAYFFVAPEKSVYVSLPKLGHHSIDKISGDTIWHAVPLYQAVNQLGDTVEISANYGKIRVVDYFFTTCQTICPAMSKEMARIHRVFLNDDSLIIFSHSVNPDYDQPEILKAYADLHGAQSHGWWFLTGNKAVLYNVARNGYLLDASEGSGGNDDFIHTQNFALVDAQGHVRGIYDGLDKADVDKLIKDIEHLKREMRKI